MILMPIYCLNPAVFMAKQRCHKNTASGHQKHMDSCPETQKQKKERNTLLDSCYLYSKTKIPQIQSIHMPKTHRSVSRDIEAKAKGGKNKNKNKKRGHCRSTNEIVNVRSSNSTQSQDRTCNKSCGNDPGSPAFTATVVKWTPSRSEQDLSPAPLAVTITLIILCCHSRLSVFLFLLIVVASNFQIKQTRVSLDCASMVVSLSISLCLSLFLSRKQCRLCSAREELHVRERVWFLFLEP